MLLVHKDRLLLLIESRHFHTKIKENKREDKLVGRVENILTDIGSLLANNDS
jgi:hypothetical protein